MTSPREFLCARLWGPMASWGQIAVGEQRRTWARPSRSAVLGLVAAALGIPRADHSAHQDLERALGLAVRVDNPGHPMRDYHTAQSPQQESKRRWASRHDEIRNADKLNTILSDRDYLAGASATIVLWLRGGCTTPELSAIAEKFRHPVYTLYLGRKASPLGLPIAPHIRTATSISEAFNAFDAHEQRHLEGTGSLLKRLLTSGMPQGASQSIWLSRDDLDGFAQGTSGLKQFTVRRDVIRDRRTWSFDEREEVELRIRCGGEIPS